MGRSKTMRRKKEVPWEVQVGRNAWADGSMDIEFRTEGGYYGDEVSISVNQDELAAIVARAQKFWVAFQNYKLADFQDDVFWNTWDGEIYDA